MNCTPAYKKLFYSLLLLLFLYFPSRVNAQAQCDTLIKQGVDAMWKKDHVKSLELLTKARSLAEKNHWYKQLFLATNNIGNNYHAMLDYGEALNYYLESYTLAVKELEPQQEMIVLNNIAILYSKEKKYDKAREYFRKAYTIAKENNDRIKIGLYAMNLGNVENEAGNLKTALTYIEEALPYLKEDPQLSVLGKLTLAENLLLQGKPADARERALGLYASISNANYNEVGFSLKSVIAKSYLAEKNYALAASNALAIVKEKPNEEIKKNTFSLLCDIYKESGNYAQALQYKDSVIATDEKLNEIKNGRLFENSRVKFEIQDYKNQLAIKEEKMAGERNLFYYIMAVLIALAAIAFLIVRNIIIKGKQKKLVAERNEKATALELEKEKHDNLLLEKQIKEKETLALLEQEQLKNEIEARNRKLSAKALYLSGRNELIEEIIASLSKTPELAKNPSLAAQIKTLKSHLKNNDEWDSFVTHFEEVNHGLLNRLKTMHPALTANDIRFISYIYMNLSTKEIASMLNITPEACRKRRERIATKMEIGESISLYDYISSI